MNPAFVLDCSMAIAWCFEDEETPETRAIQQRLASEAAIVPIHWFLEVTDVLAMAEKRGRITADQSDLFLSLLNSLEVQFDADLSFQSTGRLLALCREHQLTSYDAAYLDLALRRGLPLATLDRTLRAAADRVGIASATT